MNIMLNLTWLGLDTPAVLVATKWGWWGWAVSNIIEYYEYCHYQASIVPDMPYHHACILHFHFFVVAFFGAITFRRTRRLLVLLPHNPCRTLRGPKAKGGQTPARRPPWSAFPAAWPPGRLAHPSGQTPPAGVHTLTDTHPTSARRHTCER